MIVIPKPIIIIPVTNSIIILATSRREPLPLELNMEPPAWYKITASESLQHLIWSKLKEYGLPDIHVAIAVIRNQEVIAKRLIAVERARVFVKHFEVIAPDFTREVLSCLKLMAGSSLHDFVEFYGELNIALAELGSFDIMRKKKQPIVRGDCGAPIDSAVCRLRRRRIHDFVPDSAVSFAVMNRLTKKEASKCQKLNCQERS